MDTPGSPSALDASSYAEATRAGSFRTAQILLVGIAAALLLWWPTDAIVFSSHPHVREALGLYRPILVAGLLLAALLIRASPQHPRLIAGAAATLLAAVFGWGTADLGGPSAPWWHLFDLAPLVTIPFAGSFGVRAGATVTISIAGAGAFFGHRPAHMHDPSAAYAMVNLTFSTALSIAAGHYGEQLRMQAFLLRRELAREAALLEQRVREQTVELRALAGHVESAREEDRTHVARELHDALGQELTSIRYSVHLAQSRYSQERASIAANLEEINQHLNRTEETLRGILLDLRPRVLDDLGLVAAAEWLVARTQERLAVDCRLDAGDVGVLPDATATAAFRILQEALTNVARHAHASRVEVTILRNEASLRIKVRDNGRGLASRQGGLGIVGMRERALALGGEATVSAGAEGGTVVEVRLPCAPRAQVAVA